MTDTDVLSLPDDPAELKAMMIRLIREHQQREEQLQHRMALLLQSKYGPRSERVDPNQQTLFELGSEDVQAAGERTGDEEINCIHSPAKTAVQTSGQVLRSSATNGSRRFAM